MKMNNRAVAEPGQREDYRAPTIALSHVLHRIAITDEEFALAVYHPLQSISEEAVRIVENDSLDQSGGFRQRDALHKADVLHAVVPLLGTLRDIEQWELVVLVVTLYAKESHIGMILRHLTGQRELAKHLKSAILHTIDGGPTCILKADEVVVPNGHSLVTLLLNTLQIGILLNGSVCEIDRHASRQRHYCRQKAKGKSAIFHNLSSFCLAKLNLFSEILAIYINNVYLCAIFCVTVLSTSSYSINVGGELLSLEKPVVMGILNATPDSFYQHHEGDEAIRLRTRQMLDEGAAILDVGACSTRPGFTPPDEKEEMRRLGGALAIVRKEAPKAVLSVDTFRADVAKMCVEEYGVQIVNDISGGELDKEMFSTVARLGVPYVLMHMKGTPQTMQEAPHYDDLMKEVLLYFAEKIQQLRDLGQKDIILDPGFGFAKTLEHNYELLSHLEALQIFELPILIGVSRKSMIYKLLGTTAQEALNGTTVLNTICLMKGCANILRVHDVKECVEAVNIYQQLYKNNH